MVTSEPPDMVRSVQGEASQAQAGRGLAGRAQSVDQTDGEVAAGAVAADRDVLRRDPLRAQDNATPRARPRAPRETDAPARADTSTASVRMRAARPASVTMRRWLAIEPEQ